MLNHTMLLQFLTKVKLTISGRSLQSKASQLIQAQIQPHT